MNSQKNSQKWYASIKKPTWAPPARFFRPVWIILYLIIAIGYGYVLYLSIVKILPPIVWLPFLLNIIFNITYPLTQFHIRHNFSAMIDVCLVLGTLLWAMIVIHPFAPWVTYINIPYLAWICFALVLQVTLTYMNW